VKNNLMGFFLMLAALIIGFSLLLPKIHDVHSTTVLSQATVELAKKKQARLDAIKQLAPVFASQQDKVNAIIATLPKDPQIPDILVSAEAMLKETNVGFTSITPQVNASQEEINLVISGQSALQNIEALFNAISQNNRPMSISSASMTKLDNTLGFNMSILVPYFSNKAALSAGTGATTTTGGVQ